MMELPMNIRATYLFLCLALIGAASVAQAFGRRHGQLGQGCTAATCQVTPVKKPGQPSTPGKEPAQPGDISDLPAVAQEAIEQFHKNVATKAPELHDELYSTLEGTYKNLESTGQQSAAAAVAAFL